MSCMSGALAADITVDDSAAESSTIAFAADSAYKDGTYTGSAQGYRGVVQVEVIVKGGKITSINILSTKDDKGYWEDALGVIDSIIANQTTNVDVVSGATYSSNGIKDAVANALASTDTDLSFFASGTGTQADPYIIKTKDQLSKFAQAVKTHSFKGEYIELTKDIDLSGTNWEPIGGWYGSFFEGSFDGNGHTISGLTMGTADKQLTIPVPQGSDTESNGIYVGLFGALYDGAQVSNLNLTNVSVNTYTEGMFYAGTLAGYLESSVIDNCDVSGSLTVKNVQYNVWAGGLLGDQQSGGSIINCDVDVDVSASEETGGNWLEAGGIVGMSINGLVANCSSTGDVYGSLYDETKIDADNAEEGSGTVVGGIVGLGYGVELNCYASGNITSEHLTDTIGALNGNVAGWNYGHVYNSYYNPKAVLTNGGKAQAPTNVSESVSGEVVGGGSYSDAKSLAAGLNSLDTLPIDVTTYGIQADDLHGFAVSGGDVIPMDAPYVTVSNTSSGTKLSWSAVKGASEYQIRKVTANGETVSTTTKTSYTDKKAKNGQESSYTVTAVNGDGESSTAVSGYYLKGVSLKSVKSIKSGKAAVAIKAKNAKADGYEVSYTTGGKTKTVRITKSSTLKTTLKGLSKGKKYTVKVRAYADTLGSTYYSAWSGAKTVTVKK